MPVSGAFKTCTNCGRHWGTREEFLGDRDVAAVGYQPLPRDRTLGFFLFQYNRCGTTLAIHAGVLTDLFDGPVFDCRRRTEQDNCTGDCTGDCVLIEKPPSCSDGCECTYVREVLQVIDDWPKGD